jgi:hypothetical protein
MEEELVLKPSVEGSVEENLENEDELQETINSFLGWCTDHHSLCKLQNNLFNPFATEMQVI